MIWPPCSPPAVQGDGTDLPPTPLPEGKGPESLGAGLAARWLPAGLGDGRAWTDVMRLWMVSW